jgi:hypothetical protein
MSAGWLRIVGVVVGFAVLLGTGYWLSRAGKPYGQILFTVHKLVSVAMLVFILWSAIAVNKTAAMSPGAWVVVSLAALAFLILIGTGGALSAMASPPGMVRWLHKIAPYAAIPLTGLWLYLQ